MNRICSTLQPRQAHPPHPKLIIYSASRWHATHSWWQIGVRNIEEHVTGVPFIYHSCDAYIFAKDSYETLRNVNNHLLNKRFEQAKSNFMDYLKVIRRSEQSLYMSYLSKSSQLRSVCVFVPIRHQQFAEADKLLLNLLDLLDYPINVYLGGSDVPIPNFIKSILLSHRSVNKLFVDNMDIIHEKLFPISIGFSPLSVAAPVKGSPETLLDKYVREAQNKPWQNRTDAVFFGGFGIDAKGNRDITIAYTLEHCNICIFPNSSAEEGKKLHSMGTEEYYIAILRYKYVFSPFGEGPDCHRTSEIIALGAVPVVPCWPGVLAYKDLPIVVINNLTDLTIQNLHRWNSDLNGAMRVEFSSSSNVKSFHHYLSPMYWHEKLMDTSPPTPILGIERNSSIPLTEYTDTIRSLNDLPIYGLCLVHNKFLNKSLPSGAVTTW